MFNETNVCPSYQKLIINVLTRITRAVAKVNENWHERGKENIKLEKKSEQIPFVIASVVYQQRLTPPVLGWPGSRSDKCGYRWVIDISLVLI